MLLSHEREKRAMHLLCFKHVQEMYAETNANNLKTNVINIMTYLKPCG